MQKPEHPTYLHFLYIHSIYSFRSNQPFHQILLPTSSDASLPPLKQAALKTVLAPMISIHHWWHY